jgi:hypothetical protein
MNNLGLFTSQATEPPLRRGQFMICRLHPNIERLLRIATGGEMYRYGQSIISRHSANSTRDSALLRDSPTRRRKLNGKERQNLLDLLKRTRSYTPGRQALELELTFQLQTHPRKVRVIPAFEYLALPACNK